jgi:NAD(P)-dependent dehydrogenase (short-subunit alcohol dehydrogenase family)
MTEPSVGIIGGTNGMGRWLAELLTARGCRVCVTGRKTAATAADAARSCDVVVVAVPIAATSGVIAHVGPLLQSSQALMDLTRSRKNRGPHAVFFTSRGGGLPSSVRTAGGGSGAHSMFYAAAGEETWYARMKAVFEQAGYTVLEKTPPSTTG